MSVPKGRGQLWGEGPAWVWKVDRGLPICNLLGPLIKILFLLVPYGNIIIKMKRIPKEMTAM